MESQTPINSLNTENHKSYEKVGRIHNAIKQDMPIEVIENLLHTEGDINYEISKINCRGPNLLFSTYTMKPTSDGMRPRLSPTILKLLLDFGIDFTKKNFFTGRTVVQEIIWYFCKKENLLKVQGPFKNEIVDMILSAHMKLNVISNPRDDNGLSHFHIACMTNNVAVVEFFLKNGIDVDEAVNANSSFFSSYTPLHFAAKYACTETVEILLKYEANTLLKNANGLTPMHLLVDICKLGFKGLSSHVKTLNVLLNFKVGKIDDVDSADDYGLCNFHVACLVQDESKIENYLTKVTNVNQTVNFDSPVCPGYRSLHFAARSNLETFKLLLTNGANIEAKNANSETPLDLFLQKYGASEMHSILLLKEEWKSIVLSDNETKLIDVISSMETTDDFISFLNRIKSISTIHIPWDSPLWPGYTLLHLVVTFTKEASYFEHFYDKRYGLYESIKLQECLKRGCEITVADAKRSTALHLAFYLEKRYIVEFLLDHHDEANNPIDRHNLSHFHIACAIGHQKAVEHFLSSGVEINRQIHSSFGIAASCNMYMIDFRHFFICPGSTALHINIANGKSDITKILLKYGADVNAKDVYGFTSVHRLLTSKNISYGGSASHLLSTKNLKNCVGNCGLSHLHVASYFGHDKAIEKLLNAGADVNCVVNYKGKNIKQYYNELWYPYGDPDGPLNFLFDYMNFTPLHFAMLNNQLYSKDTLLLIDRGADIFKENANGISYASCLSNHEDRDRNAIGLCNNSAGIRGHFEKKFGWTKLHFACCAVDDSLIKKLIIRRVDVNAKIHSDSPVFKGYTPLHIIGMVASMNNGGKKVIDKLKKIVSLLIANGADLTLFNDNLDTPLHLLPLSQSNSFVDFFLQYVVNYEVNPTNLQGISFFHFACATHNALVIDKFLKNGVDVNQAINYFSNVYPGATALHLAIRNKFSNDHLCKIGTVSQLQVVDMLVQNGANVYATDVFGETPLFDVIKLTKLRRILIQKLISSGADVHTTNLKGDTPFELLLRQADITWEEIEIFLKAGCHFNSYHPMTHEGYLALILISNRNCNNNKGVGIKEQVLSNVIQHTGIPNIDNLGRTALHNVVSIGAGYITYFDQVIEELMNRGCDIDHQNNEGKTALHLAVNFRNTQGILGLLKNGADINITDSNGKTFIAYLYESEYRYHYHDTIMSAFVTNIRKLDYCGLPVSQQNKQFEIKILKEQALQEIDLQLFYCSMRSAKNRKIGSTSLSIYEFLMNDDMDIVYMNMDNEERQEVDRFIENVCKDGYDEIGFLLKLKYRQTIERIKLFEPAMVSLNFLMKNKVPELCCQVILMFLKNEDLKCLIASVI